MNAQLRNWFVGDDTAALAEMLNASMLDEEAWSPSSGSEQSSSASSSEEGSPRAWYFGRKGSPSSSRPTSPAWTYCSFEHGDHRFDSLPTCYNDCHIRGQSQDHYQTCSPNSVLSGQKTPFQKASLSQNDLINLQQQIENLSAQQLQALRKALAESQKVQRDTQPEKYGQTVPERGVNWGHDRQSHYQEQVRKQAERRAIAVLASQQPNERLARESRASRKSVVYGGAVPPPKVAPKQTPPAHGKEGGTGVFLPMVSRAPARASVERSKAVPAPLQVPARTAQYVNSRQAPVPTHRAFNGQQNAALNRTAAALPPNVAVVDCSEIAKIPVVSFDQRRARGQPVLGVRVQSTGHCSGSRLPSSVTSNAPVRNHRASPPTHTLPAAYGSYKEFVPQQRQWESRPGSINQVDSLGLPEEWIY